MIDDEDLWDRRREEHIRYRGDAPGDVSADSETKSPAESTPAESTPADGETKSPAESTPAESKIPHINALTKLLPEDQDRVLYSIYKDAVHAVKTTLGGVIDFDDPEHEKLISDTSSKFLKLWIDANAE